MMLFSYVIKGNGLKEHVRAVVDYLKQGTNNTVHWCWESDRAYNDVRF